MILECPGCHLRYDVGARPAGTRARCRCGTAFTVPRPTEITSAFTCPQCGALASPDDPACRYCRTTLTLAACPRCFARVFQGYGFCPHCGAHIDEPAHATTEGASLRLCPRCQPTEVHLTAHLVEGTLLDECLRCGGLWIDRSAFERLIADRDRLAALISEGVGVAPALEARPADPVALEVRYLACPDCRVFMNRKNFGDRSGVILEVCKPHGLWFDRDQLSQALRFVMAGGLEESKRRSLQKLDTELERKRAAGLPPVMDLGSIGQPHWIDLAELREAFFGALRHLFG